MARARWRAHRPAELPAAPTPLGIGSQAPTGGTAWLTRAAAADAAAWLLTNTEVPTPEVLDGYLAAVLNAEPVTL